MKKKILLMLLITLLLSGCDKLKIDISKEEDTIDYLGLKEEIVKEEEKEILKTTKEKMARINKKFFVKKYNDYLKDQVDVILKVNYFKEAIDEDIELYNQTHDKKLNRKDNYNLYKLDYDIELKAFPTNYLGVNGKVGIKLLDKNLKEIEHKIYYLKNSEGLLKNDLGNITLIVEYPEKYDELVIAFGDSKQKPAYLKIGD